MKSGKEIPYSPELQKEIERAIVFLVKKIHERSYS